MRTMHAPGQMLSDLKDDVRRQAETSGKQPDRVVRMFGIVFARAEIEFVKREILSQLDYFNQRAGKTITFYFAGYDERPFRSSAVVTVGGKGWSFDVKAFDDVRKYVETRSTWKYSGGTDLILTNARLVGWLAGRLPVLLRPADPKLFRSGLQGSPFDFCKRFRLL